MLFRTLWPAPPNTTAVPLPVEISQTTDLRDSLIFAGVVAFSASARLISAEMPLSHGGWPAVIAYTLASTIPSLLAALLAFLKEEQRAFSWVWAQLVMVIALTGVALPIALDPIDDDVDERHDTTPLRAMSWRLCSRLAWLRAPAAILLALVPLAAVVLMEGWDVMALSFAALVLVVLGIEPKLRSLSPIFNRPPRGFPTKALAVRSLTDSKPLSLVYRLARNGPSPTIKFEHSIYGNETLASASARVLFGGLLGKSLIDNTQGTTDDRIAPDDEERRQLPGTNRQTLRRVWPWLRAAEFSSLRHHLRRISIFALHESEYSNDPTILGALWIFVRANVAPEPLRSLLALCNLIGAGASGQCISHSHINQIWSQWLEVFAPYATSGLGYVQNVSQTETGFDNESNGYDISREENVSQETRLLQERDPTVDKIYNGTIETPLNADVTAVIDMAFSPGGSPALVYVSRAPSRELAQVLRERSVSSMMAQGAGGGDWLTRVVTGSQVDEILTRQEEWSLLLGLPVSSVGIVVKCAELRETFRRGFLNGDEDAKCCACGLLVPGPGYGLLELISDRSLAQSDFVDENEGIYMAYLAPHAFDVVSWGARGTQSADDQFAPVRTLSGHTKPRFLEAGPFQEIIFEAVVASEDTAMLHTSVANIAMKKLVGLADFSATQLHGYPLRRPTACSVLGGQVCPDISPPSDDEDADTHGLRQAELRVLACERAAVLQVGISTFFAISALLRSL